MQSVLYPVTSAGRRHFIDVPHKAGVKVRDYVFNFYFDIHQLRKREKLRCVAQLFLVEYLIYQVDAMTESHSTVVMQSDENEWYKKLERHLGRFESLLRRLGAEHEKVNFYLHEGARYVQVENAITADGQSNHDRVLSAAELRSSDVRMLHAMIFPLTGRQISEQVFDLLWPVEVLADLGNDVNQYHDDLASDSFNTYAEFVKLYGEKAPELYAQEIKRYEQLYRAELSRLSATERQRIDSICRRRYVHQLATLPDVSLQLNKLSG